MNTTELEQEQRKEIEKQWFKDHKLQYLKYTVIDPPTMEKKEIEKLIWFKPDCSEFKINYICDNNILYISGDLGEAVFQWPSKVSLQGITACNLYYFAGKCEASENGKRHREWNDAIAKSYLLDHFIEHYISELDTLENYKQHVIDGKPSPEAVEFANKKLKEIESKAIYDDYPWGSQFDWDSFLYQHGEETFGSDFGEMGDVGSVISMRCNAYLIGLQMAIKQLKEKCKKEK